MPRANARHAARENLSALLDKLRKNVRALVVDEIHFFHAELANFLLAEILALATARSAGTAAWSAFTTRWPAVTALASVTAMTAAMTTAWCAAWRAFCARRCRRRCLPLLLFLCHLVHPFNNFRKSFLSQS